MVQAIPTLSTPKKIAGPSEAFYLSSMGLDLAKPAINLSRYFPKGTQYFYGYPSGEDSQFFNNVPPAYEELVAARALVCAGDHVHPIVFASSIRQDCLRSLKEEMGMAQVKSESTLMIPENVTEKIIGSERNTLIKNALIGLSDRGTLVMAQPFLDPALQDCYRIRPELSIFLNDKKHLPVYVPEKYLPERYAEYPNGRAFADSSGLLPVPCVVKISSSSSGNGVRLCPTSAHLANAKQEYAAVSGTIIVERMIDVAGNFAIQFGISSDPAMKEEIIGVSKQLTTPEGEFIGGIIDPQEVPPAIEHMKGVMVNHILPIIRNMGWHGVGGFDVLIDAQGRPYIADPNFRMTGMTAYLCEVRNGNIRTPMLSFSGIFRGSEEDFRRHILPLARPGDTNRKLHIIAMTRYADEFRINAAMLFERNTGESQAINAALLTRLGLESRALRMLSTNNPELRIRPT